MHIIFGNFGRQTLAVIQWAYEQQLTPVSVVSVATGWAADEWQLHVEKAEQYVKQLGFSALRLSSQPAFSELIRERGQFPSRKFQWCAGFLKGLVFNEWLDTIDPRGQALILLGKRRLDSRAYRNLSEFIESSEHFGARKVWHPLIHHGEKEFADLLARAGFSGLDHRSLECDPCIHNQASDFKRMTAKTIARTAQLEQELGQTMFRLGIATMVHHADPVEKDTKDMFNMGCGSPFACGE